MAAVLAAGPGSVLSHWSAAALWGIRPDAGLLVDVTTRRPLRSRRGLRIHRSILPKDEVTAQDGIPVTTPPRTILDLAAVANRRTVERVIEQARVLELWDRLSLPDLLARHPRRRGTSVVRQILADESLGSTVTVNDLEEDFLALVDRAGLPRPQMNMSFHMGDRHIDPDAIWRKQRLIVELDGRATHGTPKAFESDRARDRALQVAGWRVVRITWRQLYKEPEQLARDLRALLAAPVPFPR
jgi:hypothetical protein